METVNLIIVLCTGVFAGFINVVAGGGSLIAMPVLIFTGLPPVVANASNRIALFPQNIFAILGFRSKGVTPPRYAWAWAIAAFLGALIGARIAIDTGGDTFNKILSGVMIGVVIVVLLNPIRETTKAMRVAGKHKIISVFLFFLIGIYGGFIQAGVGFLIMGVLLLFHRFSLVQTNSIKVFVVLIYLFASLGIFIWQGEINWLYGIVLAAGNSTGAWLASRWSVKKGDKWIKRVMVGVVLVLAVRLWFF